MRRYFGVVLALLFVLSGAVVLMAEGAKANPASDFEYDLNEEGSGVVIKKYKGKAKDVVIPSEIEEFPVVHLDGTAFCGTNIVSVVIPDFVTSIGISRNSSEGCFSECTSLTKVTLSKNLIYIPGDCFYGCKALKEISLPGEVKRIGDGAFQNCTSLESISIGDSVEIIGSGAFENCTSLKSISIGDSVKFILNGAFRDCTACTTVSIGSGIRVINSGAFSGCSSLTTFNIGVEKLEKTYEGKNYCDLSYAGYASYFWYGYGVDVFEGCSSLSLKERKKIRDTGYQGGF